MPQGVLNAMKDWTDTNIAEAKRNALGDLLGYPRDFQKDIAAFLDKVISDAEDIARWESMPPDIQQAFQPDLKEKKESLQWLEDRLAQQDGQSGVVSDSQGESVETLAKRYGVEYTDTERYRLLQSYARAVNAGDISALVGFDLYEEVSDEIHTKLVGITTKSGVVIESFAPHFIDRVIGQTADPHEGMRQGVKIEDALDALLNPIYIGPLQTRADGDIRQKLTGKRASVVFSVRDKRLIQTNPRSE